MPMNKKLLWSRDLNRRPHDNKIQFYKLENDVSCTCGQELQEL